MCQTKVNAKANTKKRFRPSDEVLKVIRPYIKIKKPNNNSPPLQIVKIMRVLRAVAISLV